MITCTPCSISERYGVKATHEAKLTEDKWVPICLKHAVYLGGTQMRFGWHTIAKDSITTRELCGN